MNGDSEAILVIFWCYMDQKTQLNNVILIIVRTNYSFLSGRQNQPKFKNTRIWRFILGQSFLFTLRMKNMHVITFLPMQISPFLIFRHSCSMLSHFHRSLCNIEGKDSNPIEEEHDPQELWWSGPSNWTAKWVGQWALTIMVMAP